MNKKQVGFILKCLKINQKSVSYKWASDLLVKELNGKNYLVCMNSYYVVGFELADGKALDGQVVKFADIERWYKLAGAGDVFDPYPLLVDGKNDNPLVLSKFFGKSVQKISFIGLNIELLSMVAGIVGNDNLTFEFTGNLTVAEFKGLYGMIALVLPMRDGKVYDECANRQKGIA